LTFIERRDLDGVTIFENFRERRRYDDATFEDEWGIVWRIEPNDIAYPAGGPVASESDLARLRVPDPDADYRLDDLQAALERFGGERAVAFLGHETFEFCHYLMGGMANLFIAYHEDPGLVDRLCEVIWGYKSRVLERAAAAGADVLITGDDYAGRHGAFMGPEHMDRWVLPALEGAVEIAHAAGLPFIKHTDGNLWRVMPRLLETGIDALDPVEVIAGMDIGEAKARFGDRIALAGNVDCTELLCRASVRDVEEAVKETIAKAAPGGGHILASSNSIHPGVKPENYAAMLEAARRWGAYPLDTEMVETYSRRNYIAPYLDGDLIGPED
jgi:uroporphyrinogen decarboxylase